MPGWPFDAAQVQISVCDACPVQAAEQQRVIHLSPVAVIQPEPVRTIWRAEHARHEPVEVSPDA